MQSACIEPYHVDQGHACTHAVEMAVQASKSLSMSLGGGLTSQRMNEVSHDDVLQSLK